MAKSDDVTFKVRDNEYRFGIQDLHYSITKGFSHGVDPVLESGQPVVVFQHQLEKRLSLSFLVNEGGEQKTEITSLLACIQDIDGGSAREKSAPPRLELSLGHGLRFFGLVEMYQLTPIRFKGGCQPISIRVSMTIIEERSPAR